MAPKAKTRNEVAHAQLRDDIVSGRWRSGQRLAFAELCAEYSVSVGVIREALVRLVEQGLVTSHPQQGFFVVDTSPQDVLDIAEVRAQVESFAVRRAIETGGLEWESEVIAAHHRLQNTAIVDEDNQYTTAWATAHTDFHSTILSGVPNRRLWTSAQQLRNMAELYRQWLPAARKDLADALFSEHQALVDAVLARDADAAAEITAQHILRQARELSENMPVAEASSLPADRQ